MHECTNLVVIKILPWSLAKTLGPRMQIFVCDHFPVKVSQHQCMLSVHEKCVKNSQIQWWLFFPAKLLIGMVALSFCMHISELRTN